MVAFVLGAAVLVLPLLCAWSSTGVAATTVERRTATSSDDAEEFATGSMYLNSSDLELVHDSDDQTIGMRWTGLAIPRGATITAAYLQFGAKESQSEATSLTIRGQAADNAATFGSGSGDVSTRTRTTAAIAWAPVAWTAGEVGANQRTPDLSAAIQEIVNRSGWASGNALGIIVTGTGHRTAYAYDGSSSLAPLLHVEYDSGPPPTDAPPIARLSVTPSGLTATADASASTDTDATPIASYRFDFGDGTAAVTKTAPTATATHTYAAAGTYTVTLTATDTGANTSAPATASVTVVAPDAAPVARLSVTIASSPALTVTADASASTDTDATPIASYRFTFGDGTAAVTTTAPTASASHTYVTAGTYTVTLTATDTGGNTSAPATASVTVSAPTSPPTTVTVERRTAASSDDAEESTSGSTSLSSSDLELVHDSDDQTIGMRWTGLAIPRGATITAAYIQFGAKESQSEVTSLTIRGQAADDAATFGSGTGNVSTRARTGAAIAWAPVAWTAGDVGANQRTPDLSAAIQEIVNRSGWASGNALAMIVTGTGHRTAYSYDGSSSRAPLLHVEYAGSGPADAAPVARLSVMVASSPALTVTADGSASTDTDATPIASYRFTFGDGTAAVTKTAPTATATHTYASAGTYTVTLTAIDTGGNTSAPATASVTVSAPSGPQIAVYAGYYDTHHADNPKTKPSPWQGSSGVVFVGQPDSPSGGWDTSALRIDNVGSGSLSSVVVTVDMGSHHFALWGTNSIPAGSRLILAQTGVENFDGSDTSPAGCYSCNPNDCLTKVSSAIPVAHVTIGGTTTDYVDPGQILNTRGVDAAGCPYTGTRNDESQAWQRIYPGQSATSQAASADSAGAMLKFGDARAADRPLWLGPASPNPARGGLVIRFSLPTRSAVQLGVYDVAGRMVRRCVDEVFDAGTYNLRSDLAGAAPGMYFIRLWTPEGTRRQSFVLVR